jgi:hypothetical protein
MAIEYKVETDNPGNKSNLLIDFDYVIHDNVTGWKAADYIDGKPVDGAFDKLKEYHQYFNVCIFSIRNFQEGGIEAMKKWFISHNFDPSMLSFPTTKLPGYTLDAKCNCFNGVFPTVNNIKQFRNWKGCKGL